MTDSADDKNNITTMKALVFHGPDNLALEGRPRPNPRHDARYSALSQNEIPAAECLKDTLERFLPSWQDHVMPAVRSGKRMLIVAHGNSLRALAGQGSGRRAGWRYSRDGYSCRHPRWCMNWMRI